MCVCVCVCVYKYICAYSLQSCLTLCDPMDFNPPGPSVHGILQARIPEWVAMPSSRGSSQPRDQTHVPYILCLGRQVLHHCASRKAHIYVYIYINNASLGDS